MLGRIPEGLLKAIPEVVPERIPGKVLEKKNNSVEVFGGIPEGVQKNPEGVPGEIQEGVHAKSKKFPEECQKVFPKEFPGFLLRFLLVLQGIRFGIFPGASRILRELFQGILLEYLPRFIQEILLRFS